MKTFNIREPRSFIITIISIIVIITFLCKDVAWAKGPSSLMPDSKVVEIAKNLPADLRDIWDIFCQNPDTLTREEKNRLIQYCRENQDLPEVVWYIFNKLLGEKVQQNVHVGKQSFPPHDASLSPPFLPKKYHGRKGENPFSPLRIPLFLKHRIENPMLQNGDTVYIKSWSLLPASIMKYLKMHLHVPPAVKRAYQNIFDFIQSIFYNIPSPIKTFIIWISLIIINMVLISSLPLEYIIGTEELVSTGLGIPVAIAMAKKSKGKRGSLSSTKHVVGNEAKEEALREQLQMIKPGLFNMVNLGRLIRKYNLGKGIIIRILDELGFEPVAVKSNMWIRTSWGKQGPPLENSSVATPGMYTEGQYRKTYEKLKGDIKEGRYAKCKIQSEKYKMQIKYEKGLDINDETKQKLQKKMDEVRDYLGEDLGNLIGAELYLVLPEDLIYPYYLRTEIINSQLEYQVALVGSYQGKARKVFMTIPAFIEFPMATTAKILRREAKMARERYLERYNGEDIEESVKKIMACADFNKLINQSHPLLILLNKYRERLREYQKQGIDEQEKLDSCVLTEEDFAKLERERDLRYLGPFIDELMNIDPFPLTLTDIVGLWQVVCEDILPDPQDLYPHGRYLLAGIIFLVDTCRDYFSQEELKLILWPIWEKKEMLINKQRKDLINMYKRMNGLIRKLEYLKYSVQNQKHGFQFIKNVFLENFSQFSSIIIIVETVLKKKGIDISSLDELSVGRCDKWVKEFSNLYPDLKTPRFNNKKDCFEWIKKNQQKYLKPNGKPLSPSRWLEYLYYNGCLLSKKNIRINKSNLSRWKTEFYAYIYALNNRGIIEQEIRLAFSKLPRCIQVEPDYKRILIPQIKGQVYKENFLYQKDSPSAKVVGRAYRNDTLRLAFECYGNRLVKELRTDAEARPVPDFVKQIEEEIYQGKFDGFSCHQAKHSNVVPVRGQKAVIGTLLRAVKMGSGLALEKITELYKVPIKRETAKVFEFINFFLGGIVGVDYEIPDIPETAKLVFLKIVNEWNNLTESQKQEHLGFFSGYFLNKFNRKLSGEIVRQLGTPLGILKLEKIKHIIYKKIGNCSLENLPEEKVERIRRRLKRIIPKFDLFIDFIRGSLTLSTQADKVMSEPILEEGILIQIINEYASNLRKTIFKIKKKLIRDRFLYILNYFLKNGSAVSITKLAEELGITRSAMNQVLGNEDRKCGYLERIGSEIREEIYDNPLTELIFPSETYQRLKSLIEKDRLEYKAKKDVELNIVPKKPQNSHAYARKSYTEEISAQSSREDNVRKLYKLRELILDKLKEAQTDKPIIVRITGLFSAGKSTFARTLEKGLKNITDSQVFIYDDHDILRLKPAGMCSREGILSEHPDAKVIIVAGLIGNVFGKQKVDIEILLEPDLDTIRENFRRKMEELPSQALESILRAEGAKKGLGRKATIEELLEYKLSAIGPYTYMLTLPEVDKDIVLDMSRNKRLSPEEIERIITGLHGPSSSNPAVATVGMYTKEQHRKTNEKLERDIREGKYIRCEIKDAIYELHFGRPDMHDARSRVEEKILKIMDYLKEDLKTLDDIELYLVPPEDPTHPYYLRTEIIDGQLEYQVAHAGSFQGRAKNVFMTVDAFIEFPNAIIARILQREAKLARERLVERNDGEDAVQSVEEIKACAESGKDLRSLIDQAHPLLNLLKKYRESFREYQKQLEEKKFGALQQERDIEYFKPFIDELMNITPFTLTLTDIVGLWQVVCEDILPDPQDLYPHGRYLLAGIIFLNHTCRDYLSPEELKLSFWQEKFTEMIRKKETEKLLIMYRKLKGFSRRIVYLKSFYPPEKNGSRFIKDVVCENFLQNLMQYSDPINTGLMERGIDISSWDELSVGHCDKEAKEILDNIKEWEKAQAPPLGMQSCPVNGNLINPKYNRLYKGRVIEVNGKELKDPKAEVAKAREAVGLYKRKQLKWQYKTIRLAVNGEAGDYRIIQDKPLTPPSPTHAPRGYPGYPCQSMGRGEGKGEGVPYQEHKDKYLVVREAIFTGMGYDEQTFLALLSHALALEREIVDSLPASDFLPPTWESLPEVLLIEEISSSPYLGANSTRDGWIGINASLYLVRGQSVKDTQFETTIMHELWHEVNRDSKDLESFLEVHDGLFLASAILENDSLLFRDFQRNLYKVLDPQADLPYILEKGKISLIKSLVTKLANKDESIRRKAAERLIRFGQKNQPETGMLFRGHMSNWLARHRLLIARVRSYADYEQAEKEMAFKRLYRMKVPEIKRLIKGFCDERGIPYPSNLDILKSKTRQPKFFEFFVKMLVDAQYDEEGKGKVIEGRIFGRDFEKDEKFYDLPIWAIKESGELDLDLMKWLWGWEKKPKEAFFSAERVSLTDFCKMGHPKPSTPSGQLEFQYDSNSARGLAKLDRGMYLEMNDGEDVGASLERIISHLKSGENPTSLIPEDHPLRQFLEGNRERFREYIQKKEEILEVHGWDIERVSTLQKEFFEDLGEVLDKLGEFSLTLPELVGLWNIVLNILTLKKGPEEYDYCITDRYYLSRIILFAYLKKYGKYRKSISEVYKTLLSMESKDLEEVLGGKKELLLFLRKARDNINRIWKGIEIINKNLKSGFTKGVRENFIDGLTVIKHFIDRRITEADNKLRPWDEIKKIYPQLVEKIKSIYPHWEPFDMEELWNIVITSRMSDGWPSLVKAMRADGIIDEEDFKVITAIGEVIKQTAQGTAINIKDKALLTEAISIRYLSDKGGLKKEFIEKIRNDLVKIGYVSKAERIIGILKGLRYRLNKERGRFTKRSHFDFIKGLENLLGKEDIPQEMGVRRNVNLNDIKGNGDDSITRHWADIFELNLKQWEVLELAKEKKPSGVIVQHIKDLGPGLQNWREGIRRYNIDMSNVRMAYIIDEISEGDRQKLFTPKPDNVILGNTLNDILRQVETDNIVYLAPAEKLKEYKDKGIKLVEKGHAGPIIELSWCLLMLTTDDIEVAYSEFLNKMEVLGLINREQVKELKDPYYIKLPDIREEVLKMWEELEQGTSYLDIWV